MVCWLGLVWLWLRASGRALVVLRWLALVLDPVLDLVLALVLGGLDRVRLRWWCGVSRVVGSVSSRSGLWCWRLSSLGRRFGRWRVVMGWR